MNISTKLALSFPDCANLCFTLKETTRSYRTHKPSEEIHNRLIAPQCATRADGGNRINLNVLIIDISCMCDEGKVLCGSYQHSAVEFDEPLDGRNNISCALLNHLLSAFERGVLVELIDDGMTMIL